MLVSQSVIESWTDLNESVSRRYERLKKKKKIEKEGFIWERKMPSNISSIQVFFINDIYG